MMNIDFDWFAIYVSLNGMILLLLGLYTSYMRITNKIANGDGWFVPMKKAIRAHGNSVEHITVFGMLILALTLLKFDGQWLGVLVLSYTAMRLSHAYGMLKPSFIPRRMGAAGTYLLQGVAVTSLFCLVLWGA